MQSYTTLQSIVLLVLRLLIAAIFLYAGLAKFAFWTTTPEGMPTALLLLMKFLSIVEPLGALALIIGYLIRWASIGLAIIMAGAVVFLKVMMNAGLFTAPQSAGLDYIVLILIGCVVLVAFGPGAWALETMWKKPAVVA